MKKIESEKQAPLCADCSPPHYFRLSLETQAARPFLSEHTTYNNVHTRTYVHVFTGVHVHICVLFRVAGG